MASEKATPKEIQTVLEAIGRGDPIPGGFAYNGRYDPPVWKINKRAGDNTLPPGVEAEEEPEVPTVVNEGRSTVGGGSGRQTPPTTGGAGGAGANGGTGTP